MRLCLPAGLYAWSGICIKLRSVSSCACLKEPFQLLFHRVMSWSKPVGARPKANAQVPQDMTHLFPG
jgi:hypothetical protein